jgi:hypothetical protein
LNVLRLNSDGVSGLDCSGEVKVENFLKFLGEITVSGLLGGIVGSAVVAGIGIYLSMQRTKHNAIKEHQAISRQLCDDIKGDEHTLKRIAGTAESSLSEFKVFLRESTWENDKVQFRRRANEDEEAAVAMYYSHLRYIIEAFGGNRSEDELKEAKEKAKELVERVGPNAITKLEERR